MKLPKLLLILAVMALSALNVAAQTAAVSAQRKPITKNEFEPIDNKAKEVLKTTSYRLTRTTDAFVNNEKKPSATTKHVEEHVPPDRSRHLVEHTSHQDLWKIEWITIGKDKFEKENEGKWKKPKKNKLIPPPFAVLETEYFSEAPILIDGKRVDVFVAVERSKTRLSNSDLICVDKQTRSYDNEGRLIKLSGEVHCKENGKSSNDDRNYIEIYEYDPNIKIEAPIK